MIIVMKTSCQEADVAEVMQRLGRSGLKGHLSTGVERTVIGVVGVISAVPDLREKLELMPGVDEVIRISRPFKLSSREFQRENTVIRVGDVSVGGNGLVVMAGPCAAETGEQVMSTARVAKEAGATILRGGAFKPSTSPYSFRGLGEGGLKILAEASEETGLPLITEVLTPQDVELVVRYADILQVGARNMQNFALLTRIGKSKRPVILKRGFSCTVTEWLAAADYLLAEGNSQVILCERGIRTFEDSVRFSLDISSIPVIKRFSHLPVVVDPSHAAGHYSVVPAVAKAAIAAGADGLLVEVHPNPKEALVDGLQSLTPSDFARLMKEIRSLAGSVGRSV